MTSIFYKIINFFDFLIGNFTYFLLNSGDLTARNGKMLTTVIGAYPKPEYLNITDWFRAKGGTDTEYPTKFYSEEIKKLGTNVEKFFLNATKDVINDQIGSPTYAADLAQVIVDIININHWKPGIYNYTNKAKISWYDLANDIKVIYGFTNIIINAMSSKDYPTKAKRPKYSLLDKTKIKNTFNITLIPYKDSLKKCIKILKNEA